MAVVLVSGGIDSAVALWHARSRGWDVCALSFDYHLRPRREVTATRRLLRAGGITHHFRLPLPFLKELEDLRHEGFQLHGLNRAPDAYVPARNMIFYSLAAYHAEILGARWIVGGHNGGDRVDFPDTSPEFFRAFHRLCGHGVRSYRERPFQVILPLAAKTKAQVVRMGLELGAPLELTWSCYWDRPRPCGRCPSCRERAAAFAEAGL